VVLYAFDFVVIVGVGFLVVVLRHFVQEPTPRHSRLPQKSQDIAQPLEVLRSSGRLTAHCKTWLVSPSRDCQREGRARTMYGLNRSPLYTANA